MFISNLTYAKALGLSFSSLHVMVLVSLFLQLLNALIVEVIRKPSITATAKPVYIRGWSLWT